MELIVAPGIPTSPARVDAPEREPLRVALVQHRWHDDAPRLAAELTDAIGRAARAGAQVVFLSEITLLRYPAFERGGAQPSALAEDLLTGPTFAFAAAAAKEHGVVVHASLYERHPDAEPLGYNTAIMVSPSGELLARTRKLHIPVTAGYYEDTYFLRGPAQADGAEPYPVHAPAELGGARFGLPTCWDEWFPEVARAYSLGGADVIAYPTAIGSEPDHPDFDTAPLWRQVIVGNGISSGTFMVVPNRWGNEGAITFYGSSFISDPYGRILVEAPRDASAVLVADLDLDQRRDWLTLFPFLATRRPDTYGALVEGVEVNGPLGGAQLGGAR
ncbi:nitrilase-related carbon-nitrogen hydrolase [Tsukamurella tyrosinosolvens]|uniref:nitrilase-related carbon-nitrogen hydrolase n=1 Tax=Tsukamurella tyrosinosolvens TaxID=57704 RepID=UPI0036C962EA